MAALVTVKLRVFIPSEAVHYSVLGYGGTYNGGMKCDPSVSLDLSRSGPSSMSFTTPVWSVTRSYSEADGDLVSGKPEWFRKLRSGAPVLKEERLERTPSNLDAKFVVPSGGTHGVMFNVVGANPLLSAPAIDADITVGLRRTSEAIQYMVSGEHDGFPCYSISINDQEIYLHDCVHKGESPSALKPPMDYRCGIAWRSL